MIFMKKERKSVTESGNEREWIESDTLHAEVDALKARRIARRFLEQSYSTVTISDTFFEGDAWKIATNVGLAKNEIIQVTIDSKTGKILNCWHAGNIRLQIPDEIKAYQDTISQTILTPDI